MEFWIQPIWDLRGGKVTVNMDAGVREAIIPKKLTRIQTIIDFLGVVSGS